MKFSEKLSQIIQLSGKDQKTIAAEAGITPVTLSRWVNGHRVPRAEDFQKVADVLGLPSTFLEDALAEEAADAESMKTDELQYWKDRAEKAEARLRALTEAHPSDADLKEVSSDEYLARLREAMRFVFNFITQDSTPRA